MLTNAKCRWAICIYHGETSIFRNLSSRCTYTRTTQLGIIRGEKKETSIYNSERRMGEGEAGMGERGSPGPHLAMVNAHAI